MKLEGQVYDFGDKPISEHLSAIAAELNEQAFINGEKEQGLCEFQPLYDLSALLERLSAAVRMLEGPLA